MLKVSIFAAIALVSSMGRADQVLILSGGGSPAGNHYSQYLQTKTLTNELRTMLPATEISVYFGAGNIEGQAPLLADVHRVVKKNATSREVMEPGFIAANSAATRVNVDSYFKSGKTSSMKKDETFFMLVSDHGMPHPLPGGGMDPTFSNNCIDLWAFEADVAKNQFSTANGDARCLSKDDLKTSFVQNVSADRKVFAMSQCYSGGFHQMSVDTTKTYPTADPKICGFTAVTEDTTASGCTPDVDGPGYQGYERSFTQQLTGVDVVSGARLRSPRRSFEAAHQAATIEDLAKDIPLATSDFFLWKWALAIENSAFAPRTTTATAGEARQTLERTTIGGKNVANMSYAAKENFFVQMKTEFVRLYPEYAAGFNGSLADHKALEIEVLKKIDDVGAQLSPIGQQERQGQAVLLNAWTQYVAAGQSKLSPLEINLETGFFGLYDAQYGPGTGDNFALYMMSMQGVKNQAMATALSDYKAQRYPFAMEWARTSGNAQLVAFAANLEALKSESEKLMNQYFELQNRHGHVRRLLIYRQVLGAWNSLSKMQDTQALSELQGLLGCEGTKLP